MTKRVMLFCALCLLLAFTLKPEALAGFGNVEWGASPQEVQKQFGIKIDKRHIQVASPIRSVGLIDVPVKIYQDITGIIQIRVNEG